MRQILTTIWMTTTEGLYKKFATCDKARDFWMNSLRK